MRSSETGNVSKAVLFQKITIKNKAFRGTGLKSLNILATRMLCATSIIMIRILCSKCDGMNILENNSILTLLG
jgi:hypothetical protein